MRRHPRGQGGLDWEARGALPALLACLKGATSRGKAPSLIGASLGAMLAVLTVVSGA